MSERQVKFTDGRQVGFSALGDPLASRLVLICHATPGAGGFDPDPLVTSLFGAHIITLDRPGYGASEGYPSGAAPTVGRWADDVADYLVRIEQTAESTARTDFGTIGVIGWREGGIYAAALAARYPDLVDRAAYIGAPAPRALLAHADDDPKAWLGGPNRGPTAAHVDRDAFDRRFDRMMSDAVQQGTAGIAADLAAFGDIQIDFSASRAESLIIYDAEDGAAIDDSTWYGENLPNSSVFGADDGGLGLIAAEWERVLRHVVP